MGDETNPDLRWLTERIDRNHAETTTNIARLETRVEAIPAAMDRYVLVRVYEAERDADRARIKRLEDADNSEKAGNRSWLLGLAQMVLGAVLGIVGGYLSVRGGH